MAIDIEQYKMETGFYDVARILVDAGEEERSARFRSIFGDAQGPVRDLGAEYRDVYAEAERRNADLHAALEAQQDAAALALMEQPEPWSRETWEELKRLGFAKVWRDGMDVGIELTSEAHRLLRQLDGQQSQPGDYADQAGIDG